MRDSNVIPFPNKKNRKKKEEPFKGRALLDQWLHGDSKPIFHPKHYCDIEVRLSAADVEKRIHRLIFTIDRPIGHFKPPGVLVIQFVPKKTVRDGDSIIVSGQMIADREVPRLLAIKMVQEMLQEQMKTASG